jgi:hypothetical protein
MFGTKIGRIDRSLDKVFGRHWRTSQTAKHCELPGVTHCVGEWALPESFFAGAPQYRSRRKVARQVFEHGVEARDLSTQVRQRLRAIAATPKESASIAENARHVPNQIDGRSHLLAGLEYSKRLRRSPQCLLRTIGEGREEMPEHGALFVHDDLISRCLSNRLLPGGPRTGQSRDRESGPAG